MKTAKERFWPKVNKNGPVPIQNPELGPCWSWTGATDTPGGYGKFHINGGNIFAHHFPVLHLKKEGLLALHKCDNPNCVNPAHVYWGTPTENMTDMVKRGRANTRPGWEAMMKVRKVHSGESNRNARLTWTIVRSIRSTERTSGFMARLADEYGVTHECIRAVVNGRTWKLATTLTNGGTEG